jgi:glucan phosphorylase
VLERREGRGRPAALLGTALMTEKRPHVAGLWADLARLLTDTVGPGWVTDMDRLRQLIPLADDSGFRDLFWKAKREAKARFAA